MIVRTHFYFFETPKFYHNRSSGSTASLILRNLPLNLISVYLEDIQQQKTFESAFLNQDFPKAALERYRPSMDLKMTMPQSA